METHSWQGRREPVGGLDTAGAIVPGCGGEGGRTWGVRPKTGWVLLARGLDSSVGRLYEKRYSITNAKLSTKGILFRRKKQIMAYYKF